MSRRPRLLRARQKTHGNFDELAAVSQELKQIFRSAPSWPGLTLAQREALDMAAVKLARIVCGNPDHPDHWHDMAGYALLIVEQIQRN